MRTKWCRKIGEATCVATRPIYICEKGIFFPGLSGALYEPSQQGRDLFAWKDGFRPEGSTLDNPAGAFELMIRFWRQTHELPFQGVVIYWKDFVSFENSIQLKIKEVQESLKGKPKWRG